MTTVKISKYEYARIIGDRAEQIAHGSASVCNDEDIKGLCDPIDIAVKEFETGVIPISINRLLPNGDMIVVDLVPNGVRTPKIKD